MGVAYENKKNMKKEYSNYKNNDIFSKMDTTKNWKWFCGIFKIHKDVCEK